MQRYTIHASDVREGHSDYVVRAWTLWGARRRAEELVTEWGWRHAVVMRRNRVMATYRRPNPLTKLTPAVRRK